MRQYSSETEESIAAASKLRTPINVPSGLEPKCIHVADMEQAARKAIATNSDGVPIRHGDRNEDRPHAKVQRRKKHKRRKEGNSGENAPATRTIDSMNQRRRILTRVTYSNDGIRPNTLDRSMFNADTSTRLV